MEIFDKAMWHIDNGENPKDVVAKFNTVFGFLNKHHMLSTEGIELYELGIDSSISLHERLVNSIGAAFLKEYYDSLICLNFKDIEKKLSSITDLSNL